MRMMIFIKQRCIIREFTVMVNEGDVKWRNKKSGTRKLPRMK